MKCGRTVVTGIAVMIGLVTAGNNTRIFAQVPQLLNYQGKLTDPDGNSVLDGEYEMRFSLYDAASDGTLVWGPEEWSVSTQRVTVNDGLFNVLLGTHEPLSTTAFDVPYWLQVEVFNTDPLVNTWESFTPRRQLASAPYALRAGNVTGGADIQANTIVTTGNVGIGKTSPAYALDVAGTVKASSFRGDGSNLTNVASANWIGGGSTSANMYRHGKLGLGVSNPSSLLDITSEDSVTAGPTTLLELNHYASGTPGDGIAARIEMKTNKGTGIIGVAGYIDAIMTSLANDDSALAFWTSDGGTVSERLRIAGSGNVGIGTTSPGTLLEIAAPSSELPTVILGRNTGNPSVRGTSDLILDGDAADGLVYLNYYSTGDVVLAHGGGKVGIGTTDPQDALDVAGGVRIGTGYNASSITFNDDNGVDYAITNGNIANNVLSINADGQSRIAINGSGNVGIGTTSPSGKMEVRTSGGGRAIWGTSSDGDRLGGIYQESDTRGTISLYNASDIQRVRLETNGDSYFTGGNVGIGTVSPGTKLTVEDASSPILALAGNGDSGAISGAIDLLENTAALPFGEPLQSGFRIINDGANNLFKIRSATGTLYGATIFDRLVIERGSGNVGIGTASPTHLLHVAGVARSTQSSWATSSDIRLKNIAGNYEYGIDEITRINPVRFTYKEDNPLALPTDTEFVGVIAQELQAVIPEAVEKAGDGYLTVQNDPVFWAMVNAMKEFKVEIKKLEAENEAMKEKNEELEEKINRLFGM